MYLPAGRLRGACTGAHVEAARLSFTSWIPRCEFLPTKEEDIKEISADRRHRETPYPGYRLPCEFNPMMGHRGCRLAVSTRKEIASADHRRHQHRHQRPEKHPDWKMVPEIMIPGRSEVKGAQVRQGRGGRHHDKIIQDARIDMKYEVGTMIPDPRAALTADRIAKEASSSPSA